MSGVPAPMIEFDMFIMELRMPPPICGNLIRSKRRSVPESNLSNLSASATPGASIPVRKPPREDMSGASASARISSSSSSRNVGKLFTYALDAAPKGDMWERVSGAMRTGEGWLGGLLGERVRGALGIRLLLGLGLRCRRGAILAGLPLVGGSWTTSWTRGGRTLIFSS